MIDRELSNDPGIPETIGHREVLVYEAPAPEIAPTQGDPYAEVKRVLENDPNPGIVLNIRIGDQEMSDIEHLPSQTLIVGVDHSGLRKKWQESERSDLEFADAQGRSLPMGNEVAKLIIVHHNNGELENDFMIASEVLRVARQGLTMIFVNDRDTGSWKIYKKNIDTDGRWKLFPFTY